MTAPATPETHATTKPFYSHLQELPVVPPDPLYGQKALFEADHSEDKAFLCIGAYRTEEGKPFLLPSVMEAERQYQLDLESGRETKEYDSIAGCPEFRQASIDLLFGDTAPKMKNCASAVTLSGTGALKVASELLVHTVGPDTPVLISDPTWANHVPVFKTAGLKNVQTYPYYRSADCSLDYAAMIERFRTVQDGCIILLHVCSHNPTGVDPTDEQWKGMADVIKAKGHIVLFDSAYQGYATGDLAHDGYSVRYFMTRDIPMITCQSYSKNMGMYGDRLGCVCITCDSAATAKRTQAYIEGRVIRPMYSSPPRKPSRVALKVLTNRRLREMWEKDLKAMSDRIKKMRQMLYAELIRLKTPGRWEHIVNQIGMFSYLGLNEAQCKRIKDEFHYYILKTSRVSIAGLTEHTVNTFAKHIDTVVRNKPSKNSKL